MWCDYIWVSCDSEMVHGWLRFGSAWCGVLCRGSAMVQITFSVGASVVQCWFRSGAYSVYMVQQWCCCGSGVFQQWLCIE